MSWPDIFLIAFILILTSAGIYRGLIGELSDCFIIIAGSCMGFLLFSPVSGLLSNIMKPGSSNIISWLLVFAPVSFFIHTYGLKLNDMFKESIGEKTNKAVGGLLAFIKSWILVFFFIMILGNHVSSPFIVRSFKNSWVSGTAQSLEGPLESIFTACAPGEYSASIENYMRNSDFGLKRIPASAASADRNSLTGNETLITVGVVFLWLGIGFNLVSAIWILVIAFKTNIYWGLACLFFPPAELLFIITNFKQVQSQFYILIAGIVFLLIAGIIKETTDTESASYIIQLLNTYACIF